MTLEFLHALRFVAGGVFSVVAFGILREQFIAWRWRRFK